MFHVKHLQLELFHTLLIDSLHGGSVNIDKIPAELLLYVCKRSGKQFVFKSSCKGIKMNFQDQDRVITELNSAVMSAVMVYKYIFK